jgi:dienelactone hydrolase
MKTLILLLMSATVSYISYAQQSYEITFEHDDKTVFGTLATPDGPGPFPTIIINPGSGPNDRDGTFLVFGGNTACLYPDLVLETLTPYKDLSDAFIDSGYAVLRYDKLEFTYPTTLGTITFHKLWLPVESALGYLKTRVDVDTNRIILLGHSEGSSLIPFIAKDRSDIRALISVAGPRTPLDSLLAYQLVYIAETCNGDTTEAHNQGAQILAYFNTIRTNMWNASTPSFFGVPASAWYDYVVATDAVAENYNDADLPSLFVGLGLDFNVPLTELERLQQEVTITEDFWSLPDLIHLMTPADDPHVSEVLTDTILFWLRQQGLSTTTQEAIKAAPDVQIYPNPCTERVTLQIHADKPGMLSYALSDISGKQLMAFGPANFSGKYSDIIDTRSLSPGTYILSVRIDDNQTVLNLIRQ